METFDVFSQTDIFIFCWRNLAYLQTHSDHISLLLLSISTGLKDPVLVRLDVDSKLSDQLKLFFLATRADIKEAVLLFLLRTVIPADEQTVVFAATKHHVEYLREVSESTHSCF